MKITKKEIIKKIERNKHKIKKFRVKKIGLFGSYLKNKQTKKSDIDFLVEFEKPSFDNYAELLILLEEIFSKKIDLITLESLRPELNYIKKEVEYARV